MNYKVALGVDVESEGVHFRVVELTHCDKNEADETTVLFHHDLSSQTITYDMLNLVAGEAIGPVGHNCLQWFRRIDDRRVFGILVSGRVRTMMLKHGMPC
jgi:hypothetical protein